MFDMSCSSFTLMLETAPKTYGYQEKAGNKGNLWRYSEAGCAPQAPPLLIPPDLIGRLHKPFLGELLVICDQSSTKAQRVGDVMRLMDSVSWTTWTRPASGSLSLRTTVSGGTSPVKGQMIQEEPAHPTRPG